jgi:hypothetical protein
LRNSTVRLGCMVCTLCCRGSGKSFPTFIIRVLLLVFMVGGNLITPKQFNGHDSLGALWVSESEVSVDNAAPWSLRLLNG